MIEIAISLAVIGFALVAIIGILPIGMSLQKDNQQETIINQDASVFLSAIRSGAQGLDYLTNYVIGITNYLVQYNMNGTVSGHFGPYGYGPNGSSGFSGQYPLNSGYRIIGLLSTPKYWPVPNSKTNQGGLPPPPIGYFSNHVVAYVRSLSGPASELFPQNNSAMQDLAFSYRLTPELFSYGTYYDPTLNPQQPLGNAQPLAIQNNLRELRLTFRWPLVDPKRRTGPSQQSFRAIVVGTLVETNEAGFPNNDYAYKLYFLHPQTYTSANAPTQ